MEQKRSRISVRKILQVFVTLVVTTACVLAMLSASKMQDTRTVQDLRITIRNEKSCGFLDNAMVQDMLISSRHIDLQHTPIAKLDLAAMERILTSKPYVADAQVYVDNAGTLLVFVTQRVPVLRLFQQDGSSYYLDKTMNTVPLSDKYTHYAPVITNVPVLRDNDSTSTSIKGQLLYMVKVINADTFWSAQVAEINMTSDRRFVLIPVLGNHKIVIGDTSMLRVKLDNVFAFYQEVLNRIGWDKYQLIDAGFKGQIVASPAIKTTQKNKMVTDDMNWVKSMLGDAPPENIGADTTVVAPATVALPPSASVVASATQQRAPKPATTAPAKPKETNERPKPVISAKPADNKPRQPVKTVVTDKPQTTNNNSPKKTEGEHEPKPKYIYGH